MPVIEVSELTKYYGEVVGVDGVSFAVDEGEIFGFLGPNGAGKTTTIRLLIQLLHPDRGRITVFGVSLDAPKAAYDLSAQIKDRWPELVLGIHLHNTNGMALATALAAAQAGTQFFEGSICGIGGGIRMPYGMAPYGNVATEDLVHMFNECGVETDLDTMRVVDAAREIQALLELEDTHSYALQGAIKNVVLDQGKSAPREG